MIAGIFKFVKISCSNDGAGQTPLSDRFCRVRSVHEELRSINHGVGLSLIFTSTFHQAWMCWMN